MAVLDSVEVFDSDLSHFREKKAKLSIHSTIFELELSNHSFLDWTTLLFGWSEEHERSFSIRIFDRTMRIEKKIYLDRLLRVEGHFYKLMVTKASVQPGL